MTKEFTTYEHDEISGLETAYRRTLLNTISGVRPVHLVGSVSPQGLTNAAPFNSVVHVGANPPFLGMIVRPDTVERHTLENIRNTGIWTLSQLPIQYARQLHWASAKFPANVSEFSAVGLREGYREGFAAPFADAAPVRMGLRLAEEYPIASNGTYFLVGKVEWVSVKNDLLQEDGRVAHGAGDIAAVAGLDAYYTTQLEDRFAYARPEEEVQNLEQPPVA